MSELFTSRFWADAAERAIKTFAQILLASTTLGEHIVGLVEVDWLGSLSLAFAAALVSVLTSIVSAKTTGTSTGSLLD